MTDREATPETGEDLNETVLFDQGVINTRTDRVLDRIVQPVGWLVLIVALISVYEVVCRYGFDSPTKWVHETSTFLIAVVFLLGGVRAMARNQHVTIDLLQFLLPLRHRRKLHLVNRTILVVICAALVWVSAQTAWDATHARPGEPYYFERSGTFWNPPFPAWIKITLFLACLFLAVQSIAQLGHMIRARDESGEN